VPMLQPGDRVDRYEVVSLVGQGGMAQVFRVRHCQLGSDHALKVLTLPGVAARERMLLEGQVQAMLRHPNVVEVTDVVDVGGAPGLVMPFIDGPSLDRVLASRWLYSVNHLDGQLSAPVRLVARSGLLQSAPGEGLLELSHAVLVDP
jgi:serine/threonine protein kinase